MQTSKDLLVPVQIDDVASGLVREWYFDKKVVVYRLTHVTHKVIDQWSDAVLKSIRNWNPDTPYLALHDLSKPGVSLQYGSYVNFETINIGINQSGREEIDILLNANEHLKAHVAINFSISMSGQVNRVLANRDTLHTQIEYKLFYDRIKALEWLAAALNPSQYTAVS